MSNLFNEASFKEDEIDNQSSLIVIDAPHFYAGAIVRDNCCIEAAPIIQYMVGKTKEWIFAYCAKKKWKVKER